MRILFALSTRLLVGALFTTALTCANAQSPKSETTAQDALYQTVAALDTRLFDAVISCDMKTVNSLWADDAEFYHDNDNANVGEAKFIHVAEQRWSVEDRPRD